MILIQTSLLKHNNHFFNLNRFSNPVFTTRVANATISFLMEVGTRCNRAPVGKKKNYNSYFFHYGTITECSF